VYASKQGNLSVVRALLKQERILNTSVSEALGEAVLGGHTSISTLILKEKRLMGRRWWMEDEEDDCQE
jgi:hypothetical protein